MMRFLQRNGDFDGQQLADDALLTAVPISLEGFDGIHCSGFLFAPMYAPLAKLPSLEKIWFRCGARCRNPSIQGKDQRGVSTNTSTKRAPKTLQTS
jgi:hypothetical protein